MSENITEETIRLNRRRTEKMYITRWIISLVFILTGAFLIGILLSNIHTQKSVIRQKENSVHALEEASQRISTNARAAYELEHIYHEGNRNVLRDVQIVLSGGLMDSMKTVPQEIQVQIMSELNQKAGTETVFLMDADGTVVYGPDESLLGTNPSVSGYMTQENVSRLLELASDRNQAAVPVTVKNRFGTFWFYSCAYNYEDEKYALIISTETSGLDRQISSLRSTSAVLSRSAVINNGFLFSVNPQDHLFLYYKNGSDLLTGQNALACGLSEEALADGYSGKQRISGEEYYIVSRVIDRNTVILAAARTADVLEGNRYIILWSVTGFIAVMILCFSYTIIVRNDLRRHKTETMRTILFASGKDPLYFDRTVFRRVAPLMLAGVLAMYGISFYIQTMLEVTEGIGRSETALQEVTGRYEESMESREIIQNYYNEHFLSAARLMSFITEESSDFLNEESEFYHSVYDEEGNRVFLTDDEGNRLKSIPESAYLKELCGSNQAGEIYVYDQNGHTIATSTENWFFTISHNPEDQSYEFLDVLDGRKDSLIQSHKMNDIGFEAQYIGVTSHYYTTVNEDGETVYTTRSAWEKSGSEQGFINDNETAEGITRHQAMLQIELNAGLSDQMLASTDADTVLSTGMLDGGGIMMFDTSPEHTCVYSPNPASISKTAEALGIPAGAFSGEDYYGFGKIGGNSYFQYFRYLDFQDGYFISTALPKSSMYVSRTPIALITSAVCLVLNFLLLLMFSLSSAKEEKMLKEILTEEKAELDASVFGITLPSGRASTTVKAAARWSDERISWSQKNPQQKLGVMIGFMVGLLMLYILLSSLGISSAISRNSIVRYVLSGSWNRGLNVFSFSACIIVVAAVITAMTLLRIPVSLITALFGARGATLSHLLLSILKYGGTLGALFYCLYLTGMDARSLLASAGILSLVIGLGAQSLIQDIIAGIFIVFEGEFRVGDIVTISDYRGTVMDIGLRTTKIQAMDGNIKIFNNSSISGVLNMTRETSFAVSSIDIEYGQDIDYVEAVLYRELPTLKDVNPKILDGPTYGGINALGNSGITLVIFARCQEKNVKSVTRFMNRELLQIFYRNHINVPFPNVTVSKLDMSDRRTIWDFNREMNEKEKQKEEEAQ